MSNIINVPDRASTWRNLDGNDDNKLTYQPDSKRPNAGTFVLAKEDHTLGNLIRLQLLRDPAVRYAGYRMPHPLIFDCHVRLETMDSKHKPVKVFEAAIEDLLLETEQLGRKWEVSDVILKLYEEYII
jgi:DNA-directed RNA polymerase II subunit RPB11